MTQLEYMKAVTGEQDETLLSCLLEKAKDRLLSLTNRTELNTALTSAQTDWGVIAYNRMGTEGELSRSQGGISSSFAEIPKEVQDVIKLNRLARVNGHAFEKVST